MPSILFHELVGYKFAKAHRKFDKNNFYLGVMVPDSVNAYGFASKEERWKAHKRDVSLDIWTENIVKYYKENSLKYEKCYLMGYLIHVLTDIMCDKIYQEEIYPELLNKGYNRETAYSYYEDAIKKFENSNINEQWWNYCKESFTSADKIPINNINEKMIDDWIKYTLNKYEQRQYENEGFITNVFLNKVIEYIEKTLQEKG